METLQFKVRIESTYNQVEVIVLPSNRTNCAARKWEPGQVLGFLPSDTCSRIELKDMDGLEQTIEQLQKDRFRLVSIRVNAPSQEVFKAGLFLNFTEIDYPCSVKRIDFLKQQKTDAFNTRSVKVCFPSNEFEIGPSTRVSCELCSVPGCSPVTDLVFELEPIG